MSRYAIHSEGGETQTLEVEPMPLGAGGQGEVYRATWNGKAHALKLYYQDQGTQEQRAALERLIHKGAPTHSFLWPLRLVVDRHEGRFGYLMALREPRFRPTEDLMARRVHASFRALLHAALELADSFLQLHTGGLCYRDISFGNVFLDPATGEVRICDNDNVDVSGAAPSGVLGTPRFMAPEVVRGEAAPSADTDRFSLAVLLFYLLFAGHPLEGAREAEIRCLDLPAMNRLYGTDPLYIFDPKNNANRPVPGLHDNPTIFRLIYPAFLLQAFERSFTEGLRYPPKRIVESVWRKNFARALDLLLACPSCQRQNFFDPSAQATARKCWQCSRVLGRPPLLRLDSGAVVLEPRRPLYPHHLQAESYDYGRRVAEVTQHPSDASQLGLKNLMESTWTLTRPDGSTVDVSPGKNAPLVVGNCIHFGQVAGEVIAS
jgi:serine/threonine protein kinase